MVDSFKFRPRGKFAQQSVAPAPAIPAQELEARAIAQLPPSAGRAAMDAYFARAQQKKTFKPSPQQANFFDWVKTGSGSCVLEAVAGAGKTTTLIEALRFMEGSIVFCAYNKKIADEIKRKAEESKVARSGMKISTMHGIGYGYCRDLFPRANIDDAKTRNLLKSYLFDNPDLKWLDAYSTFITKMISFGKQFLIGCPGKPAIDNLTVWLKLMDHFSVDQDIPESIEPEKLMEHVIALYRKGTQQFAATIDFDDMIFAPIYVQARFRKNDWVLVDECQDVNPARRELAKLILKSNGRAVFVGDSRQAIYGFTGAGGDSIERIIEEFNCAKLPLTVTYRCPKQVVAHAHQWVSHIEAHEDAPEGVVRGVAYEAERICSDCNGKAEEGIMCGTCKGALRIPADPWYKQDAPSSKDAVLCRYTRPLIQTAYAMIKNGVACKVEGRDIGNGLIALATMWKIRTLDKLDERLKTYLEREIAKAQQANSEKRQQEIEDKVATVRIFMERCRVKGQHSIDALVDEIKSMFADDVKDMVCLSTGHKSKGREWPRVYWIQAAQRRQPNKDWEAEQEINIKYVICTRAQEELILVPEALAA